MQSRLPGSIDPWKLASTGGQLRGQLSLASMLRLASLVQAATGAAEMVLEAGRDEQGVRYLSGRIKATVTVVCQRCLSPMPLTLRAEYRLGLVRTEAQAVALPTGYEPLQVAEDDMLALSELVEDELILALPLAPMHATLEPCLANGYQLPQQPSAEKNQTHPFAALSTLLKDVKNQE